MQNRDGTTDASSLRQPFMPGRNESFTSGVSWGAILGGAFVAAALGITLLSLGAGLGFASVSAWQEEGASAKTIGVGAIVWLIVVQVISAGLGGYVAGRMRTKWATVHTDEVAFRDTAHGLIVWALGVVITSFVVASTASSVAGAGARAAGSAASAVGSGAASVAREAVAALLRIQARTLPICCCGRANRLQTQVTPPPAPRSPGSWRMPLEPESLRKVTEPTSLKSSQPAPG